MSDWRGDIAVIGGGIVGLATARELLRRRPNARVVILEKERAIGRHQTGHNSGVIHSGIYYAPGSLKAKTCVAGAVELTRYCEERGIPFERCGKVIVALDDSELDRLDELHRRGTANGVPGLEMIGPERLRELEPHVVGVRALWSPNTGIIDFSRVAAAYAEDVRTAGGDIRTGHEVRRIERAGATTRITTTAGDIEATTVVACAGLYADRVAALTGAPPVPRIVPFRGDYYVLRPERRHLVRGLIYPVPDPAFPFLGVHFTRRIDGAVWLGPNAVLAFARQGYRRTDVNPRDLADALTFPGFRRLATKYWRTGLAEMVRDVSKRSFLASLRVYIPELELSDLRPGPSGVRAQAMAADGTLVDDFIVDRADGILHVRNAPSPAATSSLAIAAMIADTLEQGVERAVS
ncbi:MAG: L-2-hydroxyglutarate oxidase [Dehalococcoidia bacterium]